MPGFILRAVVPLVALAVGTAAARAEPTPAQTEALLSNKTIAGLERAAAFGASLLGVPGPGPDFATRERERIRHLLPTLGTTNVDALLNADANLPLLRAFLGHMTPQQRANTVAALRNDAKGGSDAVVLAEVTATAAVAGARLQRQMGQIGGNMGTVLGMQRMVNQRLQAVGRKFGPNCSTASGEYRSSNAFCHNNPMMPDVR